MSIEELQKKKRASWVYSSENNVNGQFRKDKFPGHLARMGAMSY
jgi:hypothetical protein